MAAPCAFSATARRYHIDFSNPTSVRNDLSLGHRPQKFWSENSVRSPFSLLFFRPSSLPLSFSPPSCPKAFPNTDQLSSNCVSRLTWSLGLSVTVIPLLSELRYVLCVHTRVHTCTNVCGAACNPKIPCRGDVADRIRSIERIQYTPPPPYSPLR